MRALHVVSLLVFVASSSSCAPRAKGPVAPATPVDVGIDETALDPTVKPCDDFFQYACGGWLARTEIPADRAQWTRSFSEIDARNELVLREILDGIAAKKDGDKLGAFWGACSDEAQIETTALKELEPLLKEIDQVSNLTSLAKQVARLHKRGTGPMFGLSSMQDFADSTQVIAFADQGGLGLPDRDFYVKDDPKSKDIVAKYEEHVKKIAELAGQKTREATAQAKVVLKIETELAKASLTRTERRDPKKLYHRIELDGLKKLAPRFAWDVYLKELGHPTITALNVGVPAFFTALNEQLQKRSMPEWRTYLKWHLVHGVASMLTKNIVDENFRFYGQVLSGTAQILPRWKRCLRATDAALGEALAQAFVAKTFGSDGKQLTLEMVQSIEKAMKEKLGPLAWMDDVTRKAALHKLEKIANKIGFPDKWRSYDALAVDKASFLKSGMAADEFELHRQLDKIGKPLDRTEWLMTPPTVNAYYDASMNEMVFPAGILQTPFFSRTAHRAVNFGAIGMVMGHELTHGFDDEGRQFDADGNLKEWWTPKVNQEFEQRAQCVVEQYDSYVAIGDLHINGKLTLGENIADLGGIKLAYQAYTQDRVSKKAEKVIGTQFTDDQLFFLGYAQAWCSKRRDEEARMRVVTDPHSPPKWRVNGPLTNTPEFAAAFQCGAEAPMRSKKMCTVW